MSYQLDDLLYLMQRLRDPQHGCPWDLIPFIPSSFLVAHNFCTTTHDSIFHN